MVRTNRKMLKSNFRMQTMQEGEGLIDILKMIAPHLIPLLSKASEPIAKELGDFVASHIKKLRGGEYEPTQFYKEDVRGKKSNYLNNGGSIGPKLSKLKI